MINKRISDIMDGGKRIYKVLLYSDENVASKDAETISQALLKNQLDYFISDFKTIDADFDVLVLPPCSISQDMLEFINLLGEKDIKVFALMKPEFLPEIKKAAACRNFRICKDVNDLTMNIITSINPDVLLKKEADIFYIKKEFEACYKYLFVNAGETDVNTSAELYIDKKDKEYKFILYNPVTDEKNEINAELKNSKAVIDLKLSSDEAVIVIAELIKQKG